MEPWLKDLAEQLDEWAANSGVRVTERDSVILVHALVAPQAVDLTDRLKKEGLPFVMEDRGENVIEVGDILEAYAPFRFTVSKPVGLQGPGVRVTNTGFSDLLHQGTLTGTLRLCRCENAFETAAFRIAPLNDTAAFESRTLDAKPRRAVRESTQTRIVPDDIGAWLLRDVEEMPWTDPAFQSWAGQAWKNLARSIANEVENDALVFRGPPLVRLSVQADGSRWGGETEFRALQRAVAWVYDNERELEMRHGLLATEVARSATMGGNAARTIGRVAGPALESARIAYGLNLSQVSRDSLRALTDLRKAISDETAKLADTTRGIATSVATAVFAGAGVILARLTTGSPSSLLVLLAVVPVMYVIAVIWGGWQFVKLQRRIRSQWRQRLYIFLPEADYEQMVEGPAKDAERAFQTASWWGAGFAILVAMGIVGVVLREPIRSQSEADSLSRSKEMTIQAAPPSGQPQAAVSSVSTGTVRPSPTLPAVQPPLPTSSGTPPSQQSQ
jgi:hypothetical protein